MVQEHGNFHTLVRSRLFIVRDYNFCGGEHQRLGKPHPTGSGYRCHSGWLGNRFNGGSLTFELSVDTTPGSSAVGGLPISTAGSCFGAGGFGLISNTNGMNTLSIDVSGLVCPTVDGSAATFNGTYVVTQGTNFRGGTGTINGSLQKGTSRSSVNGTFSSGFGLQPDRKSMPQRLSLELPFCRGFPVRLVTPKTMWPGMVGSITIR